MLSIPVRLEIVSGIVTDENPSRMQLWRSHRGISWKHYHCLACPVDAGHAAETGEI